MNWTSIDDIWLLLWQNLTKTMFGHSCLPRNIPLHHKLLLHSVKVFFVPSKNVLFENLLHKGYWGPVTVFWQGVQHFSHILLVVTEDEYMHTLLETAIISSRFLFTGISVTVGSGVNVLKWSFPFLWPDCRWWWVSPLSDHLALKVPTQNGWNLKQQVGRQAGHRPELQAGSGQVGVPVVEEKGPEMEEAVLSMSGKHFWKKTCASSKVFCPSDCRVFSWTWSLVSYCIRFGCDGGLPLPVCKRLAAKALYWSSTAMPMVAKIWMINSVSDNTMWFCKKNLDLLQLDKNRFLSTAYLDNKCKHYTWLMFLIQEMLIIMAVKDKKNLLCLVFSKSPGTKNSTSSGAY